MDQELLDRVMNSDTRSVQQKGEVVLPAEWRDKHDVTAGDTVLIEATDDGVLEVRPAE